MHFPFTLRIQYVVLFTTVIPAYALSELAIPLLFGLVSLFCFMVYKQRRTVWTVRDLSLVSAVNLIFLSLAFVLAGFARGGEDDMPGPYIAGLCGLSAVSIHSFPMSQGFVYTPFAIPAMYLLVTGMYTSLSVGRPLLKWVQVDLLHALLLCQASAEGN